MKRIHPWHIVAGLGTISRQELCELLAVFEDASLGKLASDRLSDLAASRRDGADLNIDGAFQRRLTRTASRLMSSAACDDLLRLRLWTAIRRAFGREPALPLSTRSANIAAADIAHDAAAATGRAMEPEEGGASTWAKAAQQLRKHARVLFNRHAADFDAAVGLHAARLLAEAAREGRLNEKDKKELVERVRKRLADLPPELKGESVERAIRLGDVSALALLASGSSLAGLSVAVELAGFGAYIAAAQASAVIPLLSGKAAVSALFVLSHPLFIIPVLLGGGYAVERGVRRSVRRRLASGLTILLALRGLADDRRGLQSCLDAFRRLDPALVARSAVANAKRYASFMLGAREQFGRSLPAAPGPAPQSLAVTVGGERADRLREALFPQASRGQAAEAFLVAGLTLGDVVYTATAINPTVVAAVDFSRAESLASIFDFGAFAQRMSDLPERASTGAESNLCGFVAEQMVATRLVEQGHQVSFPEIANNPGYDLLVDGAEFQVKCLADIGGLREHFKKYPEIPVIANGERVHDVERLEPETAAKIFFVEGYDQETAKRLTAQNIETGAALDDLNVPVFAVAVSAARNVHGWSKGTTALADLPWEVTVNGAVKGGLAAAGGFAGKTLGLLIFGPAGAVVFGGLGGAGALLGSRRTREVLERRLFAEWGQLTDLASYGLLEALERALICKRRELDRKLDLLPNRADEEMIWLRTRLLDDRVFIAERQMTVTELMRQDLLPTDKARAALRAVHDSGVHPWTVRADIRCVLKALQAKPAVRDIAMKATKGVAGWLGDWWQHRRRGVGA